MYFKDELMQFLRTEDKQRIWFLEEDPRRSWDNCRDPGAMLLSIALTENPNKGVPMPFSGIKTPDFPSDIFIFLANLCKNTAGVLGVSSLSKDAFVFMRSCLSVCHVPALQYARMSERTVESTSKSGSRIAEEVAVSLGDILCSLSTEEVVPAVNKFTKSFLDLLELIGFSKKESKEVFCEEIRSFFPNTFFVNSNKYSVDVDMINAIGYRIFVRMNVDLE